MENITLGDILLGIGAIYAILATIYIWNENKRLNSIIENIGMSFTVWTILAILLIFIGCEYPMMPFTKHNKHCEEHKEFWGEWPDDCKHIERSVYYLDSLVIVPNYK